MNWISSILGGSVIKGASGIADIVDKFIETPDEKRAAEIVYRKLQQHPDDVQAEINKVEAGHRSLFVAGWRPAIGWICAMGLAWGWIIAPTLQFFYPGHEMPGIELGEAISLVMAMLGMGALRTYEKHENLTG
jgi:hypothetical protein